MRFEDIKIIDSKGFVYDVRIQHKPHAGFSSAIYNQLTIAQIELGKIHEPLGDNDKDWEMYEDRFAEWTDEIKANLIPACEQYFNNYK